MRLSVAVLTIAVAAGGLYMGGGAGAATQVPLAPYMYTAKYACSPEVGPTSTVFQGKTKYRTVVNVHNPNSTTVRIGKKAVVALREDKEPGKISEIHVVDLVPDGAIGIDCKDILGLFGGAKQPNGDGLVVILSEVPLDVWAVYTSRAVSSTGVGEGLAGNIDVVWVPAQRQAT